MRRVISTKHNWKSILGMIICFSFAVVFFWLAFQQRFTPDDPIIRPVFVLCGILMLFGVYIGFRYPIDYSDQRIHVYDQVDPIKGDLEITKTLLNDSECLGKLTLKLEFKGMNEYILHLWCAEHVNQAHVGRYADVNVYIDTKSKLPVAVDTIDRTYWIERVLEREEMAT